MSILKQITNGVVQQPFLGIVFGVPGVGKTSLGAEMPKPVFMGAENGSSNLNVHRLPTPKSFAEIQSQIKALTNEEHSFQTLIVDSLDWIEPLVFEQVIFDEGKSSVTSIESFGYGKGYALAIDEWRKMIALLVSLREKRRMNILLIAHAHIKIAKDPTVTEDYERYQLKLNEKAAALWSEFVDCVFFANFETHTAKDKQGKTRAFADGARYLYTERRPGFTAKNRFSLPFQIEMTQGETWKAISEAMGKGPTESPEALNEQIKSLLEGVPNEEQKAKFTKMVQDIGMDPVRLDAFKTRLNDYINKL